MGSSTSLVGGALRTMSVSASSSSIDNESVTELSISTFERVAIVTAGLLSGCLKDGLISVDNSNITNSRMPIYFTFISSISNQSGLN